MVELVYDSLYLHKRGLFFKVPDSRLHTVRPRYLFHHCDGCTELNLSDWHREFDLTETRSKKIKNIPIQTMEAVNPPPVVKAMTDTEVDQPCSNVKIL